MKEKNNHIEQLNPEIIQAYHSGKLTSSEMHQVEALMLENPFFDEGIEGLQSLDSIAFESDIQELSDRVDAITDKKKRLFSSIYIKAAAVILFLAIFTALFYYSNQETLPTKELSKIEEENKEEDRDDSTTYGNTSTKDTTSNKPKSATSTPLNEALEEPSVKEQLGDQEIIEYEALEEESITTLQGRQKSIAKIQPGPKEITLPMKNFDKALDSLNQAIRLNDAQADLVRAESLRKQSKETTEEKSKAFLQQNAITSTVQNSVKGIIIGSDDQLPLPSVTVIEKGTTNATQSNLKGEFTIGNISSRSILVVRYLGYVSQEIPIKDNAELKIELVPDATSLGEVVVTGVAAASPSKKLPFTVSEVEGGSIDGSRLNEEKQNYSTFTIAKPEGGYSKFNRYLKKNLKYPDAARSAKIKGRVTLEFSVSANGQLSDFTIIKGLGYGCNEEAIRLIKEGPKWLPKTKGTNKEPIGSIVKIRVRFKR